MTNVTETNKIHIAVVGRENVGKSRLINCIVNQELCEDNDIPGTTTFHTRKAVELLPFGQVVIIDTAGIDSEEELTKTKINITVKTISNADFVIVVLDARTELSQSEVRVITFLQKIKRPFLVAVNKIEFGVNPNLLIELEALEITHFEISCKESAGIESLRKKLIQMLQN
jgi:small GTP-binding protein